MKFGRELAFTKKLLDNFFVPLTLLRREGKDLSAVSWLQHIIAEYQQHFDLLLSLCRPGIIFHEQNELDCNFLLFQVQGGHDPVIALVGPYLLKPVTPELLRTNAAKFSDPDRVLPPLDKYYREIPYLSNEKQLFVVLYTLGGYLWNNSSIIHKELPPNLSLFPLGVRGLEDCGPSEMSLSKEALEKRYADEERLLLAVSAGKTDQAVILFNRFASRQMEQRASHPLRDMKNYFIVFNTLLRKAAEHGRVHPLYIDRISSQLARQIEAATSTKALTDLGPQMVRHYCRAVQDVSTTGHSELIGKLLVLVDVDFKADLSLRSLAQQLNVNPSYLSALFKKELGISLTEYVNRRRISYAMFLLEVTNFQVQTIAQQCGISDESYFARTFKRYVGATPREYRTAQWTN